MVQIWYSFEALFGRHEVRLIKRWLCFDILVFIDMNIWPVKSSFWSISYIVQRTRKDALKIKEYLNKIKTLADNFALAGSPISPYDLHTQILTGLDTEYTRLVIHLSDKDDLNWILRHHCSHLMLILNTFTQPLNIIFHLHFLILLWGRICRIIETISVAKMVGHLVAEAGEVQI